MENINDKTLSDVKVAELSKNAFAYATEEAGRRELNHEILKKQFDWEDATISSVMQFLVRSKIAGPPKQRPNVHGIGTIESIMIRPKEEVAKLRQVPEIAEYMVYCAIEEAGGEGKAVADIYRSLPTAVAKTVNRQRISKFVQTLLAKNLLKEVKSIHSKTKKLYIPFYIAPSKNLVGGSFYKSGDFDINLVNSLRQAVRIALTSAGAAMNFDSLTKYIRTSTVARDLTDDDLEVVLTSLEYDQEILKSSNPSTGDAEWSLLLWGMEDIEDAIESVPCFICPVMSQCSKGSLNNQSNSSGSIPAMLDDDLEIKEITHDFVSVLTCDYLGYWLNTKQMPS